MPTHAYLRLSGVDWADCLVSVQVAISLAHVSCTCWYYVKTQETVSCLQNPYPTVTLNMEWLLLHALWLCGLVYWIWFSWNIRFRL